ncbi:MAG: hypothetical protein AAF744_12775 [Pseudomonadota bacterium]
MTETEKSDAALEAFFDAARAAPPEVSPELMDRVHADAATHQPRAPRGGLRGLWALLGGGPGLGGLVTATCVGFWIGVAPPEALPDLGALVLGSDTAVEVDAYGFGWDIGVEG